MTAARTRRNVKKQAEDALQKLLVKQEAMVTKLWKGLDAAKAEAEATRRAFTVLHQVELLGMEEPARIVYVPRRLEDIDEAEQAEMPPPPDPRSHHQGINDVWDAKEAEKGVVLVHSALMYTRQDLCEWCKAGVPFQTAERTGHHVVIVYDNGVESGFTNEPCTGVPEPHAEGVKE